MQITQFPKFDYHHALVKSPERGNGGKAAKVAGKIINKVESGSNKENIKPRAVIKKHPGKLLFQSALEALFLGALKQKNQDPAGALEDLNTVLKYKRNHLRAHLERIDIHLSMRNFKSALSECKRFIKKFPKNSEVLELVNRIEIMPRK